jgi:hypothetical protein
MPIEAVIHHFPKHNPAQGISHELTALGFMFINAWETRSVGHCLRKVAKL